MTRLKLAYVQRTKDRHGTWRHYFRRRGYPKATLPGLPGSAEFMRAYEAAIAGAPSPIGASRVAPGSMAALAASWLQSPAFPLKRGEATRRNTRRILEGFLAEHGDKPYAALRPWHIRALLNERAATPHAANRLLSILRALMDFATTQNPRLADPTIGVKRLDTPESDGFKQWSEDDIAAFEARWPIGTRERLAFALLLFTAQRRSDVVRMGPQHDRGGRITFRQRKTGKWLKIPVHPALREAIRAHPSEHLTFLAVRGGKPFASGAAFYQWFKPACAAAGLPGNLSPHGLRKAAARRLAEAGCTAHELMAVTGHLTLAEAERYTRAADQARLAESAMARIGGGQERD